LDVFAAEEFAAAVQFDGDEVNTPVNVEVVLGEVLAGQEHELIGFAAG
jgi:hypothetical protein